MCTIFNPEFPLSRYFPKITNASQMGQYITHNMSVHYKFCFHLFITVLIITIFLRVCLGILIYLFITLQCTTVTCYWRQSGSRAPWRPAARSSVTSIQHSEGDSSGGCQIGGGESDPIWQRSVTAPSPTPRVSPSMGPRLLITQFARWDSF